MCFSLHDASTQLVKKSPKCQIIWINVMQTKANGFLSGHLFINIQPPATTKRSKHHWGNTNLGLGVIYFLDYLPLIHFYKYCILLLFCAAVIRLLPPPRDKSNLLNRVQFNSIKMMWLKCCCCLVRCPSIQPDVMSLAGSSSKLKKRSSSFNGQNQEPAVRDLSGRLIIRPRLRCVWPFRLPNQSKKRASLRFQGQSRQTAIK